MKKCRKCKIKYPDNTLLCPSCGQDLNYPEGNKIGYITLGLMIASYILSFGGLLISRVTNLNLSTISAISSPLSLVTFIMTIVGFCKYPSNKLCKVLFIIEAIVIGLIVSAILILLISCYRIIKDCGDGYGLLIG